MDKEVMAQVGEIAKNISIAFDGKLNSQTIVDVTKEVTPQVMQYLYFLQIKSFVVHVVWAVAVTVTAFVIGKTILKIMKEA